MTCGYECGYVCVSWWYVPVSGQVMEWVSPSTFTWVPRIEPGLSDLGGKHCNLMSQLPGLQTLKPYAQ